MEGRHLDSKMKQIGYKKIVNYGLIKMETGNGAWRGGGGSTNHPPMPKSSFFLKGGLESTILKYEGKSYYLF